MKFFVSLLMIGIVVPDAHYYFAYCQPEQIHIAYGEKTNDIVVTWSTANMTDSVVEYGETVMNQTAYGAATIFVDGGLEQRKQWIHRVTLASLKFDTKYMYHVGWQYAWSEVYPFKTPPAGEGWAMQAIIYGDMGVTNAISLPYLQKDVNGLFNAPGLVNAPVMGVILHVGDFAYDMDSDNARVGDQFMRQIECVAAKVPYMTSPGNHEQAYNFSNYRARFNMPGHDSSVFYSFNLGPVHFVSISTEVYYFQVYGLEQIGRQCEWLENDLAKANLPENRCLRPWIVVFGHRPMYCSNFDAECLLELTRCGVLGKFGLEPLMFKFGVDFVIWAHEHSYERTWPLYDNKVYNGSYEQPYVNPRAPIHVITGSAGNKEGQTSFVKTPAAWSAFRSTAYGYTRFTAYNHTHVYIQQEDVELNCTVIDSFWVVKDSHAAYNINSN